ncbi:alpha/beta hydrolase [Bifidobacterium sp. MA2]|uniref:Alpha/beta hydrolase n=1 Tax=Bifidobacterium santillanense TaxID=2809028 RepID=A0ABS5US56_9BIFI|nr:alpha/beta hydrolase [Bifidobacterium santillanense]MBT1173835.1 alpha/beta hydrolase [Bifidobacterium santillanense]
MMRTVRNVMSVIVVAAILLTVFAVSGQLMMPRWRAEPYRDHLTVASSDTAVTPRDTTLALPHEGAYRTRERDITIHLKDGGSVPAILREPVGAPGKRPACLFVHGSGTGGAEDFGDIANAMSSAGIVTLVPAKRTDDYTPLHRDYPRFARDYSAAFDLLKLVPGVDADRTGLYAESEGTWITMLMTERRHDVAFSILSSAPVFKGREQMAMAVSTYVHQAGAPRAVVRDAAKLMSLDFAPFDLEYADFDADSARDSLTMPVLVNYGIYDTAMPIEQGAKAIIDTAARHGNRNVTVRYFAANHQMRAGRGLFAPGLPLADGYTRMLSDWINGVAAGVGADGWATPQIAGAQPHQRYAAPDATDSGIIGSLGVLVALTAGTLLCFLLAAIGGVMFLIRGLVRRHRLAVSAADRSGTGHGRFPVVDKHGRALRAWPGTSRGFVRVVGYSGGLKALLAAGVVCSVLTLAALGGYLSYVGVAALYEWRDPTVMSTGFTTLRACAAVVVLLAAWLVTWLWRAWRVRRAYIVHGLYPAARRTRSSWVLGRWHWMLALLILAGMLLTLVVCAFWGLFS